MTHLLDRMVDSPWLDRVNAVMLVGAVTVAAIAAVIRQTDIFVCAMLWVWTVCAVSTGYGMGKHRERTRRGC